MRIDAVETIVAMAAGEGERLRLEQRSCRISALANGLLALPACLALLAPFALVGALAADEPDLLSAVAAKPIAIFQLGAALIVCSMVLGLAVRRVVGRLARSATVVIGAEDVTTTTRGLLGERTWAAPLASFVGVAHHIRTSLSGARHELVLVHPDRESCVLIEIAPRIAQGRIEEVCARLGLPEVPARLLYDGDRRARPAAAGPAIAKPLQMAA